MLQAQYMACSRVEPNAPNSSWLGGTTPPLAELARVADRVSVPARVVIRSRGPPEDGSQDFIYRASELDAMAKSIQAFKTHNSGPHEPTASKPSAPSTLKASSRQAVTVTVLTTSIGSTRSVPVSQSKDGFEIVARRGLRMHNVLTVAGRMAYYDQGSAWLHTGYKRHSRTRLMCLVGLSDY